MPRSLVAVVALLGLLMLASGCDKPSHENIDKWMTSKKGLGKLKAALSDGKLDPDLSAHAAENLLRRGEDETVRRTLDAMNPARREKIIVKLAPRLWNMARVEGEMAAPTQGQQVAKDTLFDLRAWADPATKEVIDGYLTDWLTGGYFEGRALAGRHQGVQIIRALGPRAGERLIAEANRVIATPDQDGRRRRIGDQLLLGLAASGSPEAVKHILDIFGMDRGDTTLADRAMGALYRAYLDPQGLFPLADASALVPSVGRLAEIAKNDRQSAQTTNDAVQLVRAAGLPHCLEPLLSMVSHPHRDPRFRWVGVNNALRCGGADALVKIAELLPSSGVTASYDAEVLGGSLWKSLGAIGQRDALVTASRGLLESKSWVARWIGAEALGALQSKSDAARIAALAKDKARLTGYWGDQSELPKAERKVEPTLGQRAQEIAQGLK